MITITQINLMPASGFTALLGGVYEHSEWVAAGAHASAPFAGVEELVAAMRSVVDASTEGEKLTLIRAHPDLAGKLARAGALTEDSTHEQAGLGLDRLSEEEYGRFTFLNESYRERFGFPFIICARLTTKDGVLRAFEARLKNSQADEITAAIGQIHHIARLRISDRVAP